MRNSVDVDQTAENGKQCNPDQTFENDYLNSVDPEQTVPENDSVDLDLDQTSENGK